MKTLIAPLALITAALAACTTPTEEPPPAVGCDGDVCTLSGAILEDMTLTADKKWVLSGGVFVGDDTDPAAAPTTLTIEPGTSIFGDTASLSFLLITRGSKLIADGTVDAPIVFTSAKEVGARGRQDWGGLIINGQAPVNGCSGDPCTLLGEAGTGTYGGSDVADNSGVVRYVRVEFAGALIDDENELNGIAFQGVGTGTTVDFVQVHMASDDCIEFFGGTVNAKHIVCTGIGDDNLDWTFGWTGKLQFLMAQQHPDAGGNGIEADNNESNHALTPVSHPTISNITLVGSGGANSGIGLLLRRGTEADISNAVVVDFGTRCFDIDDAATFDGVVNVSDSIFSCAELTDDAVDDGYVLSEMLMEAALNNSTTDPDLKAAANLDAPDLRPNPGSAALAGAVIPTDAFFDQVTFKGACGPDSTWTSGWTSFARN